MLELAAGVGETGFDAAEVIGEQGRLICTDFSPAMLAAARRRGAARGLRNVEYRVIDAEKIELEADAVDGVLCRFGYMLMVDPAGGTRRDTPRPAPGGPPGSGRVGDDGAEPVLHHRRDEPGPARPPATA